MPQADASFAPVATAYRSEYGRLDCVKPLERRRAARRAGPPGSRCPPRDRVCRPARSAALDRRPAENGGRNRPKMRLVGRDVSGGRRQRRKQIGRGGRRRREMMPRRPRRPRRRRDVMHRLRGFPMTSSSRRFPTMTSRTSSRFPIHAPLDGVRIETRSVA